MSAHRWRIVELEGDSVVAPPLRPKSHHEWVRYKQTTRADCASRLAEADIAVVNKLTIDGALLAACPQLKLIAVAATGVDNIDLDACKQANVAVTNIRHYADKTVPEHCLALTLALARNLVNYHHSVRQGLWSRSDKFCLLDYPVRDISAMTVAILGHGSLGQATGQLFRHLGARVIIGERPNATTVRQGYVPFTEAIGQADVVSLHMPLTAETKQVFSYDCFAKMPTNAILINCARGGLVDNHALIDALHNNAIAGAALDVLDEEPPRPNHPLLDDALLASGRLLITPHIAWASQQAMTTLYQTLMDNIDQFVMAQPQANRVI